MKKIVVGVLVAIFVALCFVFNAYDLDISIELTKHYNGFFEFFDDYGEMPIYIGPILFGGVGYYLCNKKYQKGLFAGLTFAAYLVALAKVIHNHNLSLDALNIGVSVIAAAVLAFITIYLFTKMKKENVNKIKDIALLGFMVTVISFTCTEILKYTWGRVRFRDLSADYSEFTRLFHINGLTGHKSFPSGHTNAGTSILLIALLVPRFTDKKWVKYLVTGVCFVYIATLAVSRIIVSAHYASDVLCGFVVGFTTLCVTHMILRKKGVIDVASNKC